MVEKDIHKRWFIRLEVPYRTYCDGASVFYMCIVYVYLFFVPLCFIAFLLLAAVGE